MLNTQCSMKANVQYSILNAQCSMKANVQYSISMINVQ